MRGCKRLKNINSVSGKLGERHRDSNWALRCVRIWRSFDYHIFCIFCIFCEGAAVLLDESSGRPMRLVPTLSFLSDRGGGVRNLSDCGSGGGSLSSRSWGGCGNLSNRGRRVEGLHDRGNAVRAQREYHDRDADDNGHAAGHDDLARCLGVHIEILSWLSECVGSARSMTAVG